MTLKRGGFHFQHTTWGACSAPPVSPGSHLGRGAVDAGEQSSSCRSGPDGTGDLRGTCKAEGQRTDRRKPTPGDGASPNQLCNGVWAPSATCRCRTRSKGTAPPALCAHSGSEMPAFCHMDGLFLPHSHGPSDTQKGAGAETACGAQAQGQGPSSEAGVRAPQCHCPRVASAGIRRGLPRNSRLTSPSGLWRGSGPSRPVF